MKEVSLDNLNKSVLSLLIRLEKDMNVAEHQTGPFGNMKSKKPSKKKLPNSIEEETSPTQILKKVLVLNKIDIADTEVNGGFGTTPDDDEDEEDEDFLMPKQISSEDRGSVTKASYEYIASDISYTDESNPSEDVFYLPSNIKLDSNDTDDNAEEKDKKKKKMKEEGIEIRDENISNSGAAREKQQYNTGAIENAQIGGQGR